MRLIRQTAAVDLCNACTADSPAVSHSTPTLSFQSLRNIIDSKSVGTIYCVTQRADTLLASVRNTRQTAQAFIRTSNRTLENTDLRWNQEFTAFTIQSANINLSVFKSTIVTMWTEQLPQLLGM